MNAFEVWSRVSSKADYCSFNHLPRCLYEQDAQLATRFNITLSRRRFSIGCRTYVGVTPFLRNLHLFGARSCDVFIYWRRVTRGVSTKEWSSGRRITEILRADEGEARWIWSNAGIEERGRRDNSEKTRQTAASSGTIPTCENPGTEVWARAIAGSFSLLRERDSSTRKAKEDQDYLNSCASAAREKVRTFRELTRPPLICKRLVKTPNGTPSDSALSPRTSVTIQSIMYKPSLPALVCTSTNKVPVTDGSREFLVPETRRGFKQHDVWGSSAAFVMNDLFRLKTILVSLLVGR
ncbi:hypothetical protein PR048_014803 [Dryococelus australis]|uniref:Uncharacterized protein n=1 Tax=Dryococelus australis TaxID=614101 RepID=A0ABQ9HFC4_9NEOP|nr:hypothetical protein PR048_014803 [Dryococelus australis]